MYSQEFFNAVRRWEREWSKDTLCEYRYTDWPRYSKEEWLRMAQDYFSFNYNSYSSNGPYSQQTKQEKPKQVMESELLHVLEGG